MKTAKIIKRIAKSVLPVSLCAVLLLGCIITANAAARKMGDVNGDNRISISDATEIQRFLAEFIRDETGEIAKYGDIDGNGLSISDVTAIQRFIAEYSDENEIGEDVYEHMYSLNARVMQGVTGVYEIKAVKGAQMSGDNAKTIGIPSVAMQNLADSPTEEAPAIIQGEANGVITVHSGGRIVNNGVINIEGLEVKPVQGNTQEQQQQETVVTDMKPSCILIEDGGILDNYGCISLKGNLYIMGTVNNYGDIVMVPGILNIHAEFNNLIDQEQSYAGHLFICQVTEAVVPITPDPNDPTKTEERRQLSEPYPGVINTQDAFIIRNDGVVAEASVQVLSNGVLGDLIIGENIEI